MAAVYRVRYPRVTGITRTFDSLAGPGKALPSAVAGSKNGSVIRGAVYEPIEAVNGYDVGWTKVPYRSIMTEYSSRNAELNRPGTEYCHPPRVVPCVVPFRKACVFCNQLGNTVWTSHKELSAWR